MPTSRLIPCTNCGHLISRAAPVCPNCDLKPPAPPVEKHYVRCAGCGESVESRAKECSKCGAEDFKGEICALCWVTLLPSKSAKKRYEREIKETIQARYTEWTYKYFHLSCIERYFKPPFPWYCPACDRLLDEVSGRQLLTRTESVNWPDTDDKPLPKKCSNCGHPSPYNLDIIRKLSKSCPSCQLPIYSFQAVSRTSFEEAKKDDLQLWIRHSHSLHDAIVSSYTTARNTGCALNVILVLITGFVAYWFLFL